MRILTILGTRPEIIRLSRIIPLLDQYCDHILVHTGQNYEDCLSDIFFRDLAVREPDAYLGVQGYSFADQIGQILVACEAALLKYRPDRILILGDTNSGLAAIVAKRLNIPVYHMEAGNRCYDDRVPEEINRRIIDHCSTVLMPYTYRSMENLIREGIARQRIFVIGNPIKEVIEHFKEKIDASTVMSDLGLNDKKYFLITMHRAENVDVEDRLRNLLKICSDLYTVWGFPVIVSLHPRTKAKIKEFHLEANLEGISFLTPLNFFDFIRLEQSAYCILTDSGTVQEEACLFRVPNVTIRDVTERPETIECGSNIIGGCSPEQIMTLVQTVTRTTSSWEPPPEYLAENVALKVCRILLSFRLPDHFANPA